MTGSGVEIPVEIDCASSEVICARVRAGEPCPLHADTESLRMLQESVKEILFSRFGRGTQASRRSISQRSSRHCESMERAISSEGAEAEDLKAQETALKPMMEGTRQYAVPLYQRRYAWVKDDWDAFWAALDQQYGHLRSGRESSPTHFLGSLVIHPVEISAHGVTVFNIIDGQQRLTSVYILLIALRDRWDEPEEKERINETYLLNKFKKGDLNFKLLSGVHDRRDLELLLDGNASQTTGQIGQAYHYFNRKLDLLEAQDNLDLSDLESALLTRLEVVDITTGRDDNAHRIFQTLNSTGRSLSQVDLLRNHFFMLLPSQAEEAYKKYWQPIEDTLGNSVDLFFWSDLLARVKGAEGTSREGVYRKWSEILAPMEESELEILQILESISASASIFKWIVSPERAPEPELVAQLERLKEWGKTLHYPLTLLVLKSYSDNLSDLNDTVRALRYTESYLVRRMLVGVPTNNLNRLFTTTVAQVREAENIADEIHRALSGQGKYWPSDDEVLAAAVEVEFYRTQRSAQRQFVLRRLEERLNSEVPDWNATSYTIEHIMPQTMTREWWEEVGPGTDSQYQSLLHTLGNLTLTSQNAQLSNGIKQRKTEILQNSFLSLNRQIVEVGDHWNYEHIRERGTKLAQIAIQEWPSPIPQDKLSLEGWQGVITSHLAGLSGSQWTSIEDLEDVSQAPAEDIRDFVISSLPVGHKRILRSDGSIDSSLPWVSDDIRAYKGYLASLGILDDLDANIAAGSHIDPLE